MKNFNKIKELKPIFEIALAMVARSEQTSAQVRTKLLRKGYEAAAIAEIIATLQAKNYLNDERAAAMLVNRRAKGSKWGAAKIKQELALKGVGKDLAASSLNHLEEGEHGQLGHDWLATATGLLRAKYKAPVPVERLERQKEQSRRVGFLVRRGFSMGQALAAMKAAGIAVEDEEA